MCLLLSTSLTVPTESEYDKLCERQDLLQDLNCRVPIKLYSHSRYYCFQMKRVNNVRSSDGGKRKQDV